MEPFLTPLLIGLFGNFASTLIADASKDYLKDKIKTVFGWLETLGEGDKLEASYENAMSEAFTICLEMLLTNIKANGYSNEELKAYEDSIKKFVQDDKLAEELMNAIREPTRSDLPSADVLRERWQALGCEPLPSDAIWNAVVLGFRRQSNKRMILSDNLREILNAETLQALKETIERQGGVKVPVRRDKYSQRMRSKFSPVDLANLMPSYAEDPGRMVIRDVFVPQHIRENPPPLEIPKDFAERIRKGTEKDEELDAEQLEKIHSRYVNQSPRPVLDVITAPNTRLLVLTGEPGSGKSTLMRYLLTGVIEPPVNVLRNQPAPWTLPFKDAFPLLIELRDFYAMRKSDQCDSFLEYVAYMGKTDQWFLDDHAANELLESGPSLVMFDGIDEIFEAADRERVMHEIAGFAQRYEHAKIIVTSRPLGYKEKILREAGFAHFGIQDLDDKQIKQFITGWFALTFPQQLELARQRIQRVSDSIEKSKPIRMLACNPMLLTIMALLAREEELPRERAKFYEKAVEVLCHHWDVNRHLQLPDEDRSLRADDKKVLLQRIAIRMQAGKGGLQGNIIEEKILEQEIQSYLRQENFQPNAAEAKKAARRIIQQLRERNYILCLRGPGFYGFVHRTFLEYLTAAEYVRRFHRQPQQMTKNELIALFDHHCREDEWQEVLRLICGQIDEEIAAEIIEHLATRTDLEKWDGETLLPELTLAVWCLGEVKNIAKLGKTGDLLLAKLIELFHVNINNDLSTKDQILFFPRLLNAVHELQGNWPGQRNIPNLAQPQRNYVAFLFWGDFVVAVLKGDREIIKTLVTATTKNIRNAAIEALAKHWPDESTRTFITERALQDQDDMPRITALKALAKHWPDESTHTFMIERALQDESIYTSNTALEALAKHWPSENTNALLKQQVKLYGFAAKWLASQHSEFGSIVFNQYSNIPIIYLDPTAPIPREHIERAAKRVNIPPEKIDEIVASLSAFMGWDITQGSGAKRPQDEQE